MAFNQAKWNKEQGYDHLKSLYGSDPGQSSKKSSNTAPCKRSDDKKLDASLDLFGLSARLEDASSEVSHCIKSLENSLGSRASSAKDAVIDLKKSIMPFMLVEAKIQLLQLKLLHHF